MQLDFQCLIDRSENCILIITLPDMDRTHYPECLCILINSIVPVHRIHKFER